MKFDYGISVSGQVTNLEDIKRQLLAENFKIEIKLDESSKKVINELKELAQSISAAFNSIGNIKVNNVPSTASGSAITPSSAGSNTKLEQLMRAKSQATLIANLESKVNMAHRTGLSNFNATTPNGTYIGSDTIASYEKLLQRAKDLDIATQNYKSNLTEVQTEVKQLAPAYQALGKEAQKTMDATDNKFDLFAKKIQNFAYYRIISFVFNTVQNAVQSIFTTTIDINTQLRDINKVLDITAKQQDALVQSANELANNYARTTMEVMKAMEYFAKAGFGLSQVESLAELSIKLQNVGDLTSEAASQFLIAANAAFKFEGDVNKLSKTIDIVNNLTNNTAYTVDKLSEAIKVAGSVAYSAGLSMEEFAAMVATVGEATQRSGREVGNGIKTILLRLTQVNDTSADAQEAISNADKALKDVGINVRDTANSFRPAMEILTELANKWDTLTDTQQRAINYNLAGVYRSNILESFLSSINEYEDNLYIALNSVGSASQENELYMNSLEAGIKKVTAAWEGFIASLSSAEGGFLSLGSVIDKVLSLVAFLLRNLETGLWALGGVGVIAIIANWTKFKSVISSIIAPINQLITGNRNLVVGIGEVDKAQKSATASLSSWLALAGLVVTVVMMIADASKRAREVQRENIKAASEEADLLIGQYGQLNILIRQYDSLYKQYKKTGEGVEELRDLQSELNAQFGIQAAGIDLVNGKYDEQIAKLQQVRKEKVLEALESKRTAYNLAQDELGKSIGDLDVFDNPISKLLGNSSTKMGDAVGRTDSSVRDDLLRKISRTEGSYLLDAQMIEKWEVDEYEKYLRDIASGLNRTMESSGKGSQAYEDASESLKYIQGLQTKLQETVGEYEETINSTIPWLKQSADSFISETLIGLQGYEKGIYDALSSAVRPKDLSPEGFEEYTEKLRKLANVLDGVDVNKAEDVWLKILGLDIGVTEDQKKEFLDQLTNTETQFSNMVSTVSEALTPLDKNVKELEDIYDATAKIFDLRRKIAEESGLTGDDYKNFADTGSSSAIIDPRILALSKEIQDDYLKYVEDINESEELGLNNQETITKLYQDQLKLKEKTLEIIAKELEIEKKRKNLNNLENERTQVSFIGGQRVYTADYAAIEKQREDILKDEQEKARLESELKTGETLLNGAEGFAGQKDILSFTDSINALEDALSKGSIEALELFEKNINDVSYLLKENLGTTLQTLFDAVKTYVGDNAPKTTPEVEPTSSGDQYNFGDINLGNVDGFDGLIDEIKRKANQ